MALLSKDRRGSPSTNGQAGGVIRSFNHDGVEIARVRRKKRELPLRHLLQFALAVFSFKIFLFLDMGPAAYGQKVADLSNGTLIERVASRAMILDPVSQWLVDGLRYGRW